ncbi:MAG: geranylgeranyl reductase family protein [Desulfurococcales archaeon]|nr:geranylgeranyl reductase family protein [Desulfurococcales archaeon]MCE4605590.1 geranylgeranyl reductase family protein [Desulfurococcales archaeon]
MARELKYDVVIVGQGPAGSSLSYLLRKSGLKVAGIDWVSWDKIWGKPCGDAIGAHHFQETGLPEPSGDSLMQKVDGIDLYSPSEEIRVRVRGEGYMIDRNKYGATLIKAAMDSGVDIYLRTRMGTVVMENGKLAGVRATGPDGETIIFRAKVVVDATGSGGSVRRKLPQSWPVYEPIKKTDASIAYRRIVELDYDIEEPEYIRIYLNEEIAPGGYWWLFPKGRHIANIGLGVQGGRGYPHPAVIYREKLMKRPDVGSEIRVLSDAGALVPTRRPANTLAWDNFLGIGDNGYTVNPIHGGGMGYAMTAAKHAAEAILESFEAGDFSRRGLWGINTRYMRSLGAKQAGLDIFRIFLQELTNDEIEWGMKIGLMGAQEAYETSVTGELKANLSALDKAQILVKMLGRPSMLLRLRLVADYMKRVKRLYEEYPEDPEQLPKWVDSVEQLYKEYKAKLGITW